MKNFRLKFVQRPFSVSGKSNVHRDLGINETIEVVSEFELSRTFVDAFLFPGLTLAGCSN